MFNVYLVVVDMQNKKEALEKYEKAKKDGRIDEDIISLLDIINSSSVFYTTSSCSGRIVILNVPEIGDKKNAIFLGKWHRPVGIKEIRSALNKYERNDLFMLMQSPIIHIVCKDLGYANALIKESLKCGFKYTSIKNITENGVLVEILSTENLHIPLGKDGKILVGDKEIEFFLEIANKMLSRAKGKLKCLEEKISFLLLSSS